ncbi:hypothetical protein Glove_100g27 [Diversispora epigaea]|uniref:Protein kinase domain-containing protein n=1 Tax=Diversispora epigaea TaxID=1348612 RepID=A0A397J4L2_9GLOM|nr:hypothetical protein Glove_100g27 [Diversispora epigaea]
MSNELCTFCWQISNKDYLSKCKSCNNRDYGRCYQCGEIKVKSNWCLGCKPLEVIPTFQFWTSGNEEVDKLIQENQLNPDWDYLKWIEFDEIVDIQFLSKGGFGSVYTAKWKNMDVALKKLNDSTIISKDFIDELRAHTENYSHTIAQIYGLTRDSNTKEYALVMSYYPGGDWRKVIRDKDSPLLWEDKLGIIYDIANALAVIHENGFVHCDLHPGNTLKGEFGTYLSDLGLCKPVNYQLKKTDEVFGIIPYMAPEVLDGKPYTPASDVYSLGIIIWELAARKAPFKDRPHDANLIMDIFDGRTFPKTNKTIPYKIEELMKSCCHKDPSKRPSSKEIVRTAYVLHSTLKYEYENIEYYESFKKADEEIEKSWTNVNNDDDDDDDDYKSIHPGAHYASRSLTQEIKTAKIMINRRQDNRDDEEMLQWSDSDLVTDDYEDN